MQHAADREQGAEEAQIEESAGNNGGSEHEKVLKGTNPRNLALSFVREGGLLIVVLEDTVGVEIAKGDEGAPPATKDAEPSLEAALWEEDLCIFALRFQYGLVEMDDGQGPERRCRSVRELA